MRVLNRVMGGLVAVLGFVIAGWAPLAFEVLSGRALPAPVASDQAAMTVWSGVAFVRAFGAVLFGIGAVLWAANARTPRPRITHAALFLSAVFAALIVAVQQVAIWSNATGWALVSVFAAMTIVSGLRLYASDDAISAA